MSEENPTKGDIRASFSPDSKYEFQQFNGIYWHNIPEEEYQKALRGHNGKEN